MSVFLVTAIIPAVLAILLLTWLGPKITKRLIVLDSTIFGISIRDLVTLLG